jgi:hypothetical protein
VHACRGETPTEQLEAALDALYERKLPFYARYKLFSAVERRVGGQGLVQFARIGNGNEMVRRASCCMQAPHDAASEQRNVARGLLSHACTSKASPVAEKNVVFGLLASCWRHAVQRAIALINACMHIMIALQAPAHVVQHSAGAAVSARACGAA